MEHGQFHPHEAYEVTLRLMLELNHQCTVMCKHLAALNPGPHPHTSMSPQSAPFQNHSQYLIFFFVNMQQVPQSFQVSRWHGWCWHGAFLRSRSVMRKLVPTHHFCMTIVKGFPVSNATKAFSSGQILDGAWLQTGQPTANLQVLYS